VREANRDSATVVAIVIVFFVVIVIGRAINVES